MSQFFALCHLVLQLVCVLWCWPKGADCFSMHNCKHSRKWADLGGTSTSCTPITLLDSWRTVLRKIDRCIQLHCRNPVPTLPTMQLDSWQSSLRFGCVLVVANVASNCYSPAEMMSGPQGSRFILTPHSQIVFHFQTCGLQTHLMLTQEASLYTILVYI